MTYQHPITFYLDANKRYYRLLRLVDRFLDADESGQFELLVSLVEFMDEEEVENDLIEATNNISMG